MINNKLRSIIALFYLCGSLFIVLFMIAALFGVFGYWIGGGDNIFSFFTSKLFTYLKVGLVGGGIGIPLWFFYYRKI
ncbi:hypothetical protein ACF958_004111 [Providencia rettgeri]